MFKNIFRWFRGNYGWFIAGAFTIFIVWCFMLAFGYLEKDGEPRPTVYDDVKISAFQPDEFFSAAEDSKLIKGTSMGKVAIKRHSSAEHRGEFFLSAIVIPYKHIPKGTRVKLFLVRYIHSELRTLKDFLLVE